MKKFDDKPPRPLKSASILVIKDHSFVMNLLERMFKPRFGSLQGARSAEDAFYNLEKPRISRTSPSSTITSSASTACSSSKNFAPRRSRP